MVTPCCELLITVTIRNMIVIKILIIVMIKPLRPIYNRPVSNCYLNSYHY